MSQVHTSSSLLRFWENVKQMLLLSAVTPAMADQTKPKPAEQEKKQREQEQDQEQQQQQIFPR